MSYTLNLQELLDSDPEAGLLFEIMEVHTVKMESGEILPRWCLKVSVPHFTSTGRSSKAKTLFNLVGDETATPISLLGTILELLKSGDFNVE